MAVISLYFFIVSLAGRLTRAPGYSSNHKKKRIAILIPAYKEDLVIVETARSARQHNYPSQYFDVYVAADKLLPGTLDALRRIPVHVKEVDFEIGSKAKSLNFLLNVIPENMYDVAVILDADNIMVPGCLDLINDAFQKGFHAVQAHRTAKNQNTSIAVLDAIGEEVNNHLFRKSQRALGFSSNTIGSGMAFDFLKLKEIYNKPGILSNPACDREVDFEMMKADIKIEYIDKAYVLDEKVAATQVYQKQRTRWLESQISHVKMFFSSEGKVKRKTKDYWNKLFTNSIPPRLLLLFAYGIIFFIFIIQYYFRINIIKPDIPYWILLFFLNCITVFISVPRRLLSLRSAKALLYLPVLSLSFIRALFGIKSNRREFLHTKKTVTDQSTNN